jgi:hypothetical protein
VAAWIKHVPFGEQHAPGSGHGLVVQVPPPVQTPVHLASTVITQLPSGLQQTPGGITGGQGFGSQTVNSACQIVSGSTHLNSAVTSQFPFQSQQAPDGGCGQALGSQVIHPMVQIEVSGQAAGRVIEHSPFRVQQPPCGDGSGHGFIGPQASQSGCQISPTFAQSTS